MQVWGKTQAGDTVHAIDIGAGDLRARILTLGAAINAVRLAGVDHDLTVGAATVAEYEGAKYHYGTIMAPVVNRISGAKAVINGLEHRFEQNFNQRHTLHSGSAGTHFKVWTVEAQADDSVTLSCTMPDSEGGFPGNQRLTARFSVTAPATLRLDMVMTTDAPCLANPANHSYWCLDGQGGFGGQRLRIDAWDYLPTDEAFIPTGEIAEAEGSALDFTHGREIAPGKPPLDNCFCLSDEDEPLRDVLWLTGRSGLQMTMATTAPGLQVYDARHADQTGLPAYVALAFEAQLWPDAPANRHFPSILLKPGQERRQTTTWRFDRA